MTALILGILALLLLAATLWTAIAHDPPREIPRSHRPDEGFGPPAGLLH